VRCGRYIPGHRSVRHFLLSSPDGLLDELAGDDDGPGAAVVSKETIELA
jgi:hypothetical protein